MSISQPDIGALRAGATELNASSENAPAARSEGASTAPTPAPVTHRSRPLEDDISRILGICVPVTVTLAEREMTVESILAITVGTIIEFDVPFDSELTLRAANRTIGKGHAVSVGENFGLCVTRVDSAHDRIDALGGA